MRVSLTTMHDMKMLRGFLVDKLLLATLFSALVKINESKRERSIRLERRRRRGGEEEGRNKELLAMLLRPLNGWVVRNGVTN